MSGLTELLARVEAATGPDREIDFAIARACGLWVQEQRSPGTGTIQVVIDPKDRSGRRRGRITSDFTASIDAAFGLVERMLPGWWCQVSNHGRATVQRLMGPNIPAPRINGNGATPPLAILAALLRALISRTPATGGKP